MKKYISIFLLAVYLLSAHSEIVELVKLPLLVEHFREHKQWDPNISFLRFVYMHYFKDDNKYGDEARDMQMPFKATHHSFVTQVGCIMLSPDFIIPLKLIFNGQKQGLLTDSSAYFSQYLSSIWQPPRHC